MRLILTDALISFMSLPSTSLPAFPFQTFLLDQFLQCLGFLIFLNCCYFLVSLLFNKHISFCFLFFSLTILDWSLLFKFLVLLYYFLFLSIYLFLYVFIYLLSVYIFWLLIFFSRFQLFVAVIVWSCFVLLLTNFRSLSPFRLSLCQG